MIKKKLLDIAPPPSNAPDSAYRHRPASEETEKAMRVFETPATPPAFLRKYGLFLFFIITISYFEFIYGLWTFASVNIDFVFPILFAIPAAALLYVASVLFPKNTSKIVAVFVTVVLMCMYGIQLIYFYIFRTPLSLYSLVGAKDAMQFWDVSSSAMAKNGVPLMLLCIPVIFLFLSRKKVFPISRPRPRTVSAVMLVGLMGFVIAMLGTRATSGQDFSQYALYYRIASPELSIRKLGVLTTMRLDLKRLMFGFEENADAASKRTGADSSASLAIPKSIPRVAPPVTYNAMDINFENLLAGETDKALLDMHAYFSSIEPTKKNKHTDILKGKNLIFIIAESFSPYAVSPELTPTLYKMSTEGFVFNNFYNPIWGVSTSDGEYVSDVGLLPKSGVWSLWKSSKNSLPFTLGNQFKKLGYLTKAYHDHTYTYYGRDQSIPNLGYDYKGLGNGVRVSPTWPESDLEMIDVTADDYISTTTQPFHTYYITVSGHMNYNFYGNYIAAKNKSFVENLPYSETAKAYIAANLELEFAVKSLIDKLEAAGVLDNTVISIVPDHYPYGLPKEALDELAGHEVESNFELYKSIFILWKKGMDAVSVDKPASTLDILPTLSNLFGLEYDSRLLMGHDIFSDVPPLVIFLNRSWITDKEMYNSTKARATNVAEGDAEYEKIINEIVADKFKYSTKILETNYYGKVVPK
ncbi:MAG: sulfatase-like hydrolase/transferase [Patescibacteria group bacterium]